MIPAAFGYFFALVIGIVGALSLSPAAKPITPKKNIPSEAVECKIICGRDRVKFFDRNDGSCECINGKN
jgi:hypothetical protein